MLTLSFTQNLLLGCSVDQSQLVLGPVLCIWFYVKDPEGPYCPDNERRSTHYPAYYTVTYQHERELDTVCLYTMYLLPSNVFYAVSLPPLRCFPLFFFS